MTVSERLASRRRVLKGALGVTVGIPLLDCFLNESGTAMAATGKALPPVYSTWFYALGLNNGRWEPKATGNRITEMGPEMQPLTRFKDKINLFSKTAVFPDGNPVQPHGSGIIGMVCGGNYGPGQRLPNSIDALVGDQIAGNTRFRSLEMTASGNARGSHSYRGGTSLPMETSAAAMYARLFGPGFVDPNAANFTPDPRIMARRSALSEVTSERKELEQLLGAGDRTRLDEYFTSLRQFEQQLEVSLQKPAPLEACTVPSKLEERPTGPTLEAVTENHKLLVKLAAHALACDQTRVIYLDYGGSEIYDPATRKSHHILTHEEPNDPVIGVQKRCSEYCTAAMGSFADFLEALDSVKEGEKTLLDRALVHAVTEVGLARIHSSNDLPQITAGGANGKLKTGYYFATNGEPTTRVGLTIQQAMGVPADAWGMASMRTTQPYGELLV